MTTTIPRFWTYTLGMLLAATLSSACARNVVHSAVVPPTTSGVTGPGVPALPDVVAVIPFQLFKGKRGDWPGAWVEFPAEVDGVRGTYELDTGAGNFWLNRDSLPPNPAMAQLRGEQTMGWTVHTERLGTLVAPVDSIDIGPPVRQATNAVVGVNYDTSTSGNSWVPGAGAIGLNGMEPFETIIDYAHQCLIFIRLDAAGHRLAAVPAYTPAATVALVPASIHIVPMYAPQWWGIEAKRGGEVDTLLVDSGTQTETGLSEAEQRLAADQLRQALVIQPLTSPVHANGIAVPRPKARDMNILGYFFLRELGVVGFNFRTRQMILYHITP